MITNRELINAVSKPSPTNHIFVADVSGSMYNTLPKIRAHLKNNLASLVKKDDTVSILYFASRGQFGSVFVGKPLNNMFDLTEINNAIDKYLQPTGCTGFVEPLNLSIEIAEELSLENGNLNSLIFMTDGYDNCWSENEILNACKKLPIVFSDIAFLEYGWYCNRALLEKMTASTNALHKFSESYNEYEQTFEEVIQHNTSKRVSVDVGEAVSVLYLDNEEIHQVNVSNGVALIPEHISNIWAIGENALEDIENADDSSKYLVLYYAVNKMDSELVWETLKHLGDVALINKFTNCFTKQDYTTFKETVKSCYLNDALRFVDGVDYDLVPDENAYTILDLLTDVVDNNSVLDLSSPEFAYSRTSRKTEVKADDTVDKLSEEIANAKTKEERKEIASKIVQHIEWTPEFIGTDKVADMTNIVMNGSRPNISIQTVMQGYVKIPREFQKVYSLPNHIDTFTTKNYTVVRDGIVNMKQLPVISDKSLADVLYKNNVRFTTYTLDDSVDFNDDDLGFLIDVTSVPLVNRSMTKNISGTEYVQDYIKLQSMKALQKVMNHHKKAEIGYVASLGYRDQYGEDTANFLYEKGIRDYGFSSLVKTSESTDVYISKELNVKIKGASSLPAISAVEKKIAGNKPLNAGDILIKNAMQLYDTYTSSYDNKDDVNKWILTESTNITKRVRDLNKRLAVIMYGVVVGHAWFNDIDFESPTIAVKTGGNEYTVTVALEEKEIKI